MKKRLLTLLNLFLLVLILVACEEKPEVLFNVTFDLNGGTATELIENQEVKDGGLVTKPTDPTKTNYGFLYWANQENNEEWKFSDNKVLKDTTLIANWKINEYTVTFDGSGGTNVPEPQIVEHGTTASVPDDVLENGADKFDGWYLEDALFDFNIPITSDITLKAKWIPIEDLINLDLNGINIVLEDEIFILPSRTGETDLKITWTSNNPLHVTNSGVVNAPSKYYGDQTVILTASVTANRIKYTKDFLFAIPVRDEPVVTEIKNLSFTNLTSEYEVLDSTINAYYVDNGKLPYLDIKDFLLLLDGLIYADELLFAAEDHILTISYDVTDEEENETTTYTAVVDLFLDTLFVEDMDFFSYYIKSTATDYSEGINYVDFYEEKGNGVTFELAKYFVDMFLYEEGDDVYYLVPYNFLSSLFTSESYYNFYYNGEEFYGFYAIPSSGDEDDEYDTYKTIKTSKANNTTLDIDVAFSTFHQLNFIFDYFFGLKYEKVYGIEDTFYEINGSKMTNYLTTTSSLGSNLRTFIFKTIDELHSSFHFPGYYNHPNFNYTLELSDLGQRVRNWYSDGVWPVQNSIELHHKSESRRPDWQFLDAEKETALIYLNSFETATVDEEKTRENDSDQFMKEVLAEIHTENPNVKRVGIDISYNTGGNLGALLRVLGYVTEKAIEMSYQDPLTGKNQTYFIELDTDAYEDIDWFLVTSPVTFSAANLMAAIFKNQELGVIIGYTSGGGASSIMPFVLGDGALISISSNNILSVRTENTDGSFTYHSIEYGVVPDLYLSPINSQNKTMILDLLLTEN